MHSKANGHSEWCACSTPKPQLAAIKVAAPVCSVVCSITHDVLDYSSTCSTTVTTAKGVRTHTHCWQRMRRKVKQQMCGTCSYASESSLAISARFSKFSAARWRRLAITARLCACMRQCVQSAIHAVYEYAQSQSRQERKHSSALMCCATYTATNGDVQVCSS
eukprot:2746-Heterococcus_DN1.PRE.1